MWQPVLRPLYQMIQIGIEKRPEHSRNLRLVFFHSAASHTRQCLYEAVTAPGLEVAASLVCFAVMTVTSQTWSGSSCQFHGCGPRTSCCERRHLSAAEKQCYSSSHEDGVCNCRHYELRWPHRRHHVSGDRSGEWSWLFLVSLKWLQICNTATTYWYPGVEEVFKSTSTTVVL